MTSSSVITPYSTSPSSPSSSALPSFLSAPLHSSISATTTTSNHSSFHSLSSHWTQQGQQMIRLKTLCHKEILFKLPPSSSSSPMTVSQLKFDIATSSSSYLSPSDLLLISNGKKLHDDQLVTSDLKMIYVMIKPTTSTLIPIHIKYQNKLIIKQFPLNIKIIDLKKLIYDTKECNLTPLEQRAICSTRLMKDHSLLGDYLINSCCGSGSGAGCGGVSIQNKSSLSAHSSHSSHSPSSSSSHLTIYITKTMNLKRDLNVNLTLPNGRQVTFPLQFNDSLYFIRDILEKQFGLPIPLNLDLGIYFSHDLKTRLSLEKSLYDYGIYPPTKSVTLMMRNGSSNDSLMSLLEGSLPMPLQGLLQGGHEGNTKISLRDGCIYVTIEEEDLKQSQQQHSSPSSSSSTAVSATSGVSGAAAVAGNHSSSSSKSLKSSGSGNKMFSGMKRGFLAGGNTRSCKLKTSSTADTSSSPSSSPSSAEEVSPKKNSKSHQS